MCTVLFSNVCTVSLLCVHYHLIKGLRYYLSECGSFKEAVLENLLNLCGDYYPPADWRHILSDIHQFYFVSSHVIFIMVRGLIFIIVRGLIFIIVRGLLFIIVRGLIFIIVRGLIFMFFNIKTLLSRAVRHFLEAFLLTYYTFTSPGDLIFKLIYR